MQRTAAKSKGPAEHHPGLQPCPEKTPEKLFSDGIGFLRADNIREAMLAFKRALELKPAVPRYMSYYGLCWAMTVKGSPEAVLLCRRAVEKSMVSPDLYCNLGKVYLIKGDRRKAYQAFLQGLSVDGDHRELLYEIRRMGLRQRPLLPFLSRAHFLNHLAGKLRHWSNKS